MCALITAASLTLLVALAIHDFSLRYVAEHSSRDMPLRLVAAAFYSGQQGSLLYWAWTLSIFTAMVAVAAALASPHRELMPYVIAVLMGVEAFLACSWGSWPARSRRCRVRRRRRRAESAALRQGHAVSTRRCCWPGYMSWTVPFAFAIAALATGGLDAEWIALTRRYALVAWPILGIGNLLGAWWAYHVLGWGGYWGWDPVENAAHHALAGRHGLHPLDHDPGAARHAEGLEHGAGDGHVLPGIFGTFVVRSGVITSVHSFAQSSIGPYFLTFLALVIVGSLVAAVLASAAAALRQSARHRCCRARRASC